MLIVAVAVFNIVATLIMVVNDKRTDIAILRTLGLSPRGVIAVFMTQGVLIGWIGAAVGVALGLALGLNVDVIVPFLEQHLGFHIMDPDVYYISGLPSEVHPGDVLRIAAAALGLTLGATVYPALQAARTSTGRSAAVRMMGYWYEGFLGVRYLRASPKRGSVSLIAGIAIIRPGFGGRRPDRGAVRHERFRRGPAHAHPQLDGARDHHPRSTAGLPIGAGMWRSSSISPASTARRRTSRSRAC